MFEHSIKVPRLYKTAAKIVERVKNEGTSVKQLVYEKKHPNVKAIYALVVETLRNEENLKIILKKTEILENENRLDQFLARVLITELLWGKKKLSGDSKPVKTILSYQEKFLDNYMDKKTKIKKQKINKPKYVRVNTLKISVEEAINSFRDEGWSLIRCGDGSDYSAFLATFASLSEDQFMVDTLIKDLLIFPPKTEFYEHKLYKNGSIVLQDKASCLSPYLLAPPEGATVLDMCAAPGMKCIQVASMIGPSGKVYAMERDPRRYDILKSLLDTTDSKNATPMNNDVLKLTDFDVPDVEYILVDPSCSGSGIIDRIDFEDNPKIDGSRLMKLAGFQIKILRHALQHFKNAKKIVYSTCSIYPEENEMIIQEAIEKTENFKLVPLNEVLKNKWYNFGSKEYKIGSRCLYAKPEIDKTNGFFIAVFEKLENDEKNEFYIERKPIQRQNFENFDEIKKEKLDISIENRKRKNLNSEEQNVKTEKFHSLPQSFENDVGMEVHKKHKKKCKKSKKEASEAPNNELSNLEEVLKKISKKKKRFEEKIKDNQDVNEHDTQIEPKDSGLEPKINEEEKKNKEGVFKLEESFQNEGQSLDEKNTSQNNWSEPKIKKKRKKNPDEENIEEQIEYQPESSVSEYKMKKNEESILKTEENVQNERQSFNENITESKIKKKRKVKINIENNTSEPKMKKKKRKKEKTELENQNENSDFHISTQNCPSEPKMKKKSKTKACESPSEVKINIENLENYDTVKSKKKRKKISENFEETNDKDDVTKMKTKKIKNPKDNSENDCTNTLMNEDKMVVNKKKKKKSHKSEEEEEECILMKQKKCKKSHKNKENIDIEVPLKIKKKSKKDKKI